MIWAKSLLSCINSSLCLHLHWHYNIGKPTSHPLSFSVCLPVWSQSRFLTGAVMPLFSLTCKALLIPKQTPVPKLGVSHLFCPSLENAIKPAWQLCRHKGQRGLHGKKLCKIHSSKGCIKNILAKKSSSSKWSIVSSASHFTTLFFF